MLVVNSCTFSLIFTSFKSLAMAYSSPHSLPSTDTDTADDSAETIKGSCWLNRKLLWWSGGMKLSMRGDDTPPPDAVVSRSE
ncbi:hypothetical protein BpHYR1_048320 [Brachionus plicatilis]|uniref:Secreted protein n=1 Tax=Brachionus plicatilis TaxID=10195 RepID=A0A3M7PK61_BRAPC|nr:hypothetical protein BpHYR1_048320 [Brachionus plicatilis]